MFVGGFHSALRILSMYLSDRHLSQYFSPLKTLLQNRCVWHLSAIHSLFELQNRRQAVDCKATVYISVERIPNCRIVKKH
jgi:hypothetical protein